MRIENRQEKISCEVEIPDDLYKYFQFVNLLIAEADELATTESDDLIQTKFAYGGLIQEGSQQYGFRYFPRNNTNPKWDIELSATEINQIALGIKKSLYLWKCQNLSCENLFPDFAEACIDCDFIDPERDDKKIILAELLQSKTQEEWVKEYLKYYPDAHPLAIIGDYNSRPELGRKWGHFTTEKMRTLIEKCKS